MSQRRIVISGTCGYEVSGLVMLLKSENFDVQLREKVDLAREDVLLMALSAEPLLNWWRLPTRFSVSGDTQCCQTIFLVPKHLRNIQQLFARIQVVDGTLPVELLKYSIVKLINMKRNELDSSKYQRLCKSRIHASGEVDSRLFGNKTVNKRYYRSRTKTRRHKTLIDA